MKDSKAMRSVYNCTLQGGSIISQAIHEVENMNLSLKKKKSKYVKEVDWWGEREEKGFYFIFLQFDANPLCWARELCVIFINEEQLYRSEQEGGPYLLPF